MARKFKRFHPMASITAMKACPRGTKRSRINVITCDGKRSVSACKVKSSSFALTRTKGRSKGPMHKRAGYNITHIASGFKLNPMAYLSSVKAVCVAKEVNGRLKFTKAGALPKGMTSTKAGRILSDAEKTCDDKRKRKR